MKTRIFLIAMLFAASAFRQPVKSANRQEVLQQLAFKNYCGYLSAGCPGGPVEIKIASNGTSAYVVAVTVGGSAIPYSVTSIAPVPGSSGVFSVNLNYQCSGTWTNYVGGAYTSTC
jgi:hypothetical protein